MIIDINTNKIKSDKRLLNMFVNTYFNNISINCNTLKGNFFSDSFYYFPITENDETFSSLFTRDLNNTSHFYSQKFFDNFTNNKNSLKNFKGLFVLGSNAGNNYYSNLLQFLPRIFFNKKTNLKLAIHRNSSNKYRNFIGSILKSLNIEFTFVFLDDDFYHFIDSDFPQFLNMNDSIKILKKFINPKDNKEISKKIYVTREDSNYRKIINEGDVVTLLREKGYKVINPQLYEIDEQIEIFSNAEKIIAPHGSNLANIIFCKPGTQIFEITPTFKDNEKILEDRYLNLCLINNLKHNKIVSDTVEVENHSALAKKYIHKNVLSQSNYYKNLIVKINELSNLI
ncbi:glycosyltransferase family 61 protein [Pelagibacteraceae bacterium]|nr:glycosyltransferase family 61 protein [Pelagibacteraceae bacterium]